MGGREDRAYLPRVAMSLEKPMLLRGPEEGCPSGRTIGQMIQCTILETSGPLSLGVTKDGPARRRVPFWENNRSDGTMTPSWRDLDLFPRVAIALTVGQSGA